MFEALVDFAHLAIVSLASFYQLYSKIVLLQFPNSQIYPLCKDSALCRAIFHKNNIISMRSTDLRLVHFSWTGASH